MRKTALLLAMILVLNPSMSYTVSAAEDAAVYAGQEAENDQITEENSGDCAGIGAEGESGEQDGGQEDSAQTDDGSQENGSQPDGGDDGAVQDQPDGTEGSDDISPADGTAEDVSGENGAGGEENAGEQPGDKAEGSADADPAEETDGKTDADEAAVAEGDGVQADADEAAAAEDGVQTDEDGPDDAEETDGQTDEISFDQEEMDAAAVSYRIYDKAHETPQGYLAVLFAQAGAYQSPGKVISLTYAVDGQTYEAELVRDKENELRVVGFYLHKGLTGAVKTIAVKMRYAVGQGALTENTYEATQRIQLISSESSMTYSAVNGDKALSDGSRIRIAVSLYTGSADKVKYSKVALRKTGSTEKVISGVWTPETQSKEDVLDPRYDVDYRVASPYAEYVEGTIQCKEAVQEGTYDLILYQDGGTVDRQVFTNYLSVTHQNAIYDGGYVTDDDIFSIDNSGSDSVMVWVYGIGLSSKTVPVLYQTIAGRKRAVTSTLLGYEPLTGAKEGAVYCLRKDGFKNDLANTVMRFPDGQVYDGSNKSVVECAYHFGVPVYSVNGKETASGVLGVDTHVDCDADKIVFYLAEAYVKSGGSVSISVRSQAGEGIIEKASVGVQRDAGGRLYAEVGKETDGYVRMRSGAYYTAEIYNAEGIKNAVSFSMTEPGYHKSNLTVSKGCTWEICQVNKVPGTILSGTKTGKNVLTAAQIEELKKYGPVRYKIIKEESVVLQEKAFFGSGKAPKREPTPEELVEKSAKPILSVKENSLTASSVTILVETPEYIRKNPAENYYMQLTVENVRGEKRTVFQKCTGRKNQVFPLTFEPDGDSYAITARAVYSTVGSENAPYNTYGKISKELIITLLTPYEKALQISGSNVKILQGETDLYNVARIDWKNAHEKYRKIASIELTEFPEDADVASMKRALYYNQEESVIKLNAAMLMWAKLPAGQYKVRIEAMQRAEKKPAAKTFVIRIGQGVADMKVSTESTRYYKEKGRLIKIKTVVEAVDYTGRAIPSDKLGKLNYSLEKSIKDMQINQGSGIITVGKGFEGEETNQVYVTYRGSRYISDPFQVTNVKCHIKSASIEGISEERLGQGNFKSFEIDQKKIIAVDDNEGELSERMLKYTVKGPSVKVDKHGVIHTTGTAGKTIVTVMMNDGSKEKVQIELTIINDAVHLEAHYMNGGALNLVSAAEDRNNQNTILLNGGNFICLDIVGSNGEQVKDGTTNYKLEAKKGRFVDYGKITDHTKRKTGKYIFIPRSSADVITLTDKSVTPAAVTSYKISIAAFERENSVKFKSKTVRVYETGPADTVNFELPGNVVDYTGYTAVLCDDYENSFKNEKVYKKYRELDTYLSRRAVVEPGNVIQFNIGAREKLPLGTYGMKLYLYKDGKEIAPISVKLNIAKCKKPSIVLQPKRFVFSAKKKSIKVKVQKKRCRSVSVVGIEAKNIGRSYFKNKFPDYFELVTDENGKSSLVCKAADPKTIPRRDRKGIIRYRVVDLAGISHDYTFIVSVGIK